MYLLKHPVADSLTFLGKCSHNIVFLRWPENGIKIKTLQVASYPLKSGMVFKSQLIHSPS